MAQINVTTEQALSKAINIIGRLTLDNAIQDDRLNIYEQLTTVVKDETPTDIETTQPGGSEDEQPGDTTPTE